jgi:beta-galactosidase
VCPDADNLVTFVVQGEGVIAGVDNGDPTSHEPFEAKERRAFHGLCLAVLEATRTAGGVTLMATSEGLEGATVTLETRDGLEP